MDKNTRIFIIIALSIITVVVVGVGGFVLGKAVSNNPAQDQYFPMMGFRRGMSGSWNILPSGTILSLEEAEHAVERYIESINTNEDLRVGEIMIFDNHAYAQVIEEDSGIGAFEVIVDPDTNNVNIEQGASMMWNLKYGHMRGPMMGGNNNTADGVDMPITANESVSIASDYLKNAGVEMTVDDHADTFYGYYTIHTLENGEITGMLSVNGYSGQIIIHNWHGELIEMDDHAEDSH